MRGAWLVPVMLVFAAGTAAVAQGRVPAEAATYVPDLRPMLVPSGGELAEIVRRYSIDSDGLERRYAVELSPARRKASRDFVTAWLTRLQELPFDSLGQDGRVDWLLLKNRLEWDRDLLAREERQMVEAAPLLPFADTIMALEEARRRMVTVDPAGTARTLSWLAGVADSTRRRLDAGLRADSTRRPSRIVALRAVRATAQLRETFRRWYRFHDGYHPLFTWWASNPFQKADTALGSYIAFVREKLVGARPGQDEPIVGQPIGREAILQDLAHEFIAYTPEELIAIAEREYAWSEAEIKRAARDMGLGDDWRAALERVKQDFVEPGQQPDLVRDLALEAVRYVEEHDLVTVPPLAEDIWRMEMLSPERQKESPFFLGGEVVQVSFPTSTMAEEDKLMSLRGNNRHFARATVFHELIPGHHLQGFMNARYQPQRQAFRTPFWVEGNAFYWEMVFWDLGFPQSPQNRIGMLFWRMHRSARIIFSLKFHLGQMTPDQAIDFLVDKVGHERANATAEVRRSFNGDYPPLYQVAYMIGALQFRGLRREMVDSARMTNRAFHDAILQNGPIPVELVRALLERQPLTREWKPSWRFAGR